MDLSSIVTTLCAVISVCSNGSSSNWNKSLSLLIILFTWAVSSLVRWSKRKSSRSERLRILWVSSVAMILTACVWTFRLRGLGFFERLAMMLPSSSNSTSEVMILSSVSRVFIILIYALPPWFPSTLHFSLVRIDCRQGAGVGLNPSWLLDFLFWYRILSPFWQELGQHPVLYMGLLCYSILWIPVHHTG